MVIDFYFINRFCHKYRKTTKTNQFIFIVNNITRISKLIFKSSGPFARFYKLKVYFR